MAGFDVPAATERLHFGIWQDNDAALADAIWADPEVTRLTGGPFSPAAVAQRLSSEIANWRQSKYQYWPIFHRQDASLIGCCGLRPRAGDQKVAELGFQLCQSAWGQGFASEAAGAVIAWARLQGFAGLVAGHHPENEPSKRVLLRLGFSYTHHELYPPTAQLEPCYHLPL